MINSNSGALSMSTKGGDETSTQRLDMMRSVAGDNTSYKLNRTTTPPANSSYMAIDSLDEIDDNDEDQYDRTNESNRVQPQPQAAVVKKTYFSSFV